MMGQHPPHRQPQAGQVGRVRLFIGRECQQRRARGCRLALATTLAQQPLRPFLRVHRIARSRVARLAVAGAVQFETQAQRGQQFAFETTQGPGQAGTDRQPRARLTVGELQLRQRVQARAQAQGQFTHVATGHQSLADQSRRSIQRLGSAQLRQLAALLGAETDPLQRLQGGAQHLPLRR
ncbi:hypothetical protein G6F57_015859 [Rhizopus arrhizus]|nr:hypothetical protein G6F57_015859 [Rhizopus arrhizus]